MTLEKNSSEIISGYSHSFNVDIAKNISVNAAIVYNHISYWIDYNSKKKNAEMKEGRYWMYETQQEMANFLSYLTVEEVKKSVVKLLDAGLLIKGNFNKSPFDKTAWYALATECFQKSLTKEPHGAIGSSPERDLICTLEEHKNTVVVVREKILDVVVEDVHKIEDEEKKRAALASFDLSKKDIDEILPMPIERIETAIAAVNQYSETKDVDNVNGLLKTAIKEEWKPKKKIKAKAPIKPQKKKESSNDPMPPGNWRCFWGKDKDEYEEDEIYTHSDGYKFVLQNVLSRKQKKLKDEKDKLCT